MALNSKVAIYIMSARDINDRNCVRLEADADKLSAYFSATSNETRLRMLYVLWRAGELCVCDLADLFEITQPSVSRHLKILKEKALVEARRDAQTIYYRVCTDNPFARLLVHFFKEREADRITLNLDELES